MRTAFAVSTAPTTTIVGVGVVCFDERQIVATSRGRLLLRIIAMCFDRYLNESALAAAQLPFSRAS